MPEPQTHELDASIRKASAHLKDAAIVAPEVILLLAAGSSDIQPLLKDSRSISLIDVPGTPAAWRNSSLMSGKLGDARVWLCEDSPGDDAKPWGRAWPIWLARQCGAGRALLCLGASPLAHASPAGLSEGFFLAEDHLMLEGVSPLRALSSSNLGPLFPDQAAVHDKLAREALLKRAQVLGLPCGMGVLACIPGPALETPAEQRYHALAGAHASAQNAGSIYHAMAHSGLSGLTVAALLGEGSATVEELVASAQRLAPGLVDLILAATELLATNTRLDATEQL